MNLSEEQRDILQTVKEDSCRLLKIEASAGS